MKRIVLSVIVGYVTVYSQGRAQSGTIATYAGTGNGYSGDGGPATAATLDGPSGLAMDISGNLYIADTGNNVIRKVSPKGVITTYAGNGSAGFSGDGGQATAASLNINIEPVGIAVDASGNLYIADTLNNRVRMVSAATGIITTVAGNGFGATDGTGGFSGDGGMATAAELFAPTGLAIDSSSNLYIADLGNMRVRKVSTGGIITTIAGSGCTLTAAIPSCGVFSGDGGPAASATLNRPSALAFDEPGNLYIADNENNRIRKVSPTGIITTFAGIGPVCPFSNSACTGSFSGDGGPAISAALNAPQGLAVDRAGNVYISDTNNLRVRVVSPSGTIATYAGSGNFDHNIFDSAGDGGPATSADLNLPDGLATDAAGDLYIADNLRGRVREVLVAGSTPPAAVSISALSPSSATAGGPAFSLTVNGSGFLSNSTVDWNGSAVPTQYGNASQLTASIAANLIATSGSAGITVVTGAGTSNTATFTINAGLPVISSLSPNAAAAGGPAFTLTVNGSGFATGSMIAWNGSPVATTYVSATQLTASIPAGLIASAGSAIISVVTSGAGASNSLTLTISSALPAISGLNPSGVTAGTKAFTLTVNGSNFTSSSTVQWNGTGVATSFVNATQLAASIPANLVAAPASVTIAVVDTVEGTSNAVIFGVGGEPGGSNAQLISHIADGGGWRSILLLANAGAAAAPYTVSFWNDAGSPYVPMLSSGVPTGTIPVGGSVIVATADAAASLGEGWAQMTSSQTVGGTAIFRYDPWGQEAAVPLLTAGGTKLKIPYQAGNGLALGVALANTNATQTANITEVIRDQNGNQLSSRALTLAPLGHTAFNPTVPGGGTAGGVVEYDSDVSLFGLGIRSAPQGSGLAFTSLDAVVPQAASTKTISHIADGGGWRSTIVLVNTDTAPAQYALSFWTDTGSPYVPPLALGTATGTIPVGGSTIIETADAASTLTEGWAQVTSGQALGGTAIFRYDPWSQEAAVPLLTGGGTSLEIPYQAGDGLSIGVALANPSSTQTATITEAIRDANGKQLSSRMLTLGPQGHTAFNPTFPANTTGGGVVEYDSNVALYGLGIRSAPEGSGLAFTSVRAIYK